MNTNGELTDAEFHHVLHSKMLGAYDAAMSLALAWNVTLHNFTTEELGIFLNQSWKASGEGKQMLAEAMQSNMINVVSPYTGLAVRKIFTCINYDMYTFKTGNIRL